MANLKQYAYFLKGNKLAIVENDITPENDPTSRDYGPDSRSIRYKSPTEDVTNVKSTPPIFISSAVVIRLPLGFPLKDIEADEKVLVLASDSVDISAVAGAKAPSNILTTVRIPECFKYSLADKEVRYV